MDAAYAGMFERYGDMVLRLATARTGNKYDAEDLLQEVFVRLVKYAPELQSEEHKKAWLIRTTLNCAASFKKSAWKRKQIPSENVGVFPASPQKSGGNEVVFDAVMALPERYRTVIHLFYYEELSTAEIAKVMDTSDGAVRTLLNRARGKLKKTLGDETL